MKMDYFDDAMQKLSQASERNFRHPGALVWPDQTDSEAWQFTPELISLFPTPFWKQLDEATRKRLAFFEAINFFSLNIHGEKYLISEVSRRLYRDDNLALNRYLLHFLEEETKHMMYFSRYCQRYAGKVYPDNTLAMRGEDNSGVETFLLFARIYLFEEIVDEYNRIIAADERVSAIAREINHVHHVEEARHLAFGRKFLHRQLEQLSDGWDSAIHDYVRQYLQDYLQMIWKQYYNPRVYRDAGIDDAFEVWHQAYRDPAAVAHRRQISTRRLGFLRELELIEIPA